MEISKEKLWEIFNLLPDSLKEAVLSEDTAEAIWNICRICNIEESKISQVSKLVGNVLMGLLPPNRLKDRLQEIEGINPETAQKLDVYISHYVFDPVKEELEEIYSED
ncbi:hypothetical protein J7J74_02965 [bacterium]|nr:hypothetical protein [bacterium]